MESLPHGPNETVEVNYGFDLCIILIFRFLNLKTIEDCSDGDPNGVVGEVEARANPAHNKRQESSARRWSSLLSRTWRVCGPSSKPKRDALSTGILEVSFVIKEPFRVKCIWGRVKIRVSRHCPFVDTTIRDFISRNQSTDGLTRYWPRQRALWVEHTLCSCRRLLNDGQALWMFHFRAPL